MRDCDRDTGKAAGWEVEQDPQGGFRWSAFGPRGSRGGHAETRGEAERAAQQAEEELSRPFGPS
jgi:hypothetical protein